MSGIAALAVQMMGVDWPTLNFFDWLADWLAGCAVNPPTDCLTDWLTG